MIGGKYFNVQLDWNKKYGNPLYAPGKAQPKKPSEHKIVGQPIKREDVAPKVFAQEDFVTDVKVPGMVHGRMIRPPVAGAVPVKVDEASIKNIPGAKVVWDKGFLGVVADKEWDAIQAAREAEGGMVGRRAAVPANRPRSTSTSARRRCASARSRSRTAMSRRRSTDGRESDRGRIRMAVPVACQHGPGLRAGRDQGRQGHRAGAGRRSRTSCSRGCVADARPAGRQGARHLDVRPRLLRPQRRRRRRHGCRRAGQGRRPAGAACSTCAHEGTGWDPKGPASIHQARAGARRAAAR